jgi:hypothetical protein
MEVARIRLDLDPETFSALMDRALRERRPVDWQAEVIIRQALGLTFPYPAEIGATQATAEAQQ